jgi:hypothetical protein
MNWDRNEGDLKHFKKNVKDSTLEIDDAFNTQIDITDKHYHSDDKRYEMQFIARVEAEDQLAEWKNMPKSRKHIRKPEHSINKIIKKSK